MIQTDIQQSFTHGERLTNAEVRRRLQTIYDRYNINKNAKTTDLLLFGIRTKRITIKQGKKRLEGVLVLCPNLLF